MRVATRARFMQDLPSGAMLAVRQGRDELNLPEGIHLAAINSPKLCTVSGSHEDIAAYQRELEANKIACRTPYVAGLGWYTLLDEPSAPGSLDNGLLDSAGRPKPAYAAYRNAC